MDEPKAMETDHATPALTADPCNPSTVLDLNPTAFVDDLYNAVRVIHEIGCLKLWIFAKIDATLTFVFSVK